MTNLINGEFKELIHDFYHKGIFAKLEEDYLLRGIFSRELVKHFLNKETKINKFSINKIKQRIRKGYEVQQIIDLMDKHGYTESLLVIDKEYLDNWYHNVFRCGGVLKRMEIQKLWDSDFGAFYLEIEVDMEFEDHTVEITSFLDFMKAFTTHEDKVIHNGPGSFGYLLDPWAGSNPLVTKLNLTSGLQELLKTRKVKKLEVEVIDGHEAYVFYEFYPALIHRNY